LDQRDRAIQVGKPARKRCARLFLLKNAIREMLPFAAERSLIRESRNVLDLVLVDGHTILCARRDFCQSGDAAGCWRYSRDSGGDLVGRRRGEFSGIDGHPLQATSEKSGCLPAPSDVLAKSRTVTLFRAG
jgi:hypothetical protein